MMIQGNEFFTKMEISVFTEKYSVLTLRSLTIWGSLVEKSKDCLRPRGQCQGRQLL